MTDDSRLIEEAWKQLLASTEDVAKLDPQQQQIVRRTLVRLAQIVLAAPAENDPDRYRALMNERDAALAVLANLAAEQSQTWQAAIVRALDSVLTSALRAVAGRGWPLG